MSRATLDEIQNKPDFSEGQLRRGAALHAIMEDPRRTDHDSRKMATIFVVNPDIFYYAFYFRYNKNDRIPLFQDIFTLCNYIIIDEFHYYNPKQLANFLFFMRLSKELGYIDSYTKRQFCLLTATPSQKVDEYLSKLSFPIDRIDPATVTHVETGKTGKVRALAPVHLEIYSIDELRQGNQGEVDGLIALVDQKRTELARWINNGEDGAILSSSLWRIEQIYKRLRSHPALAEHLGRITGPEQRKGREEAAHKSLILATPTVDIGYNFEKSNKSRQNIDFLFFDARSSDEFIQRLGRAGRVLGKQQQAIPSRVYAVVDPEFYKALLPYHEQTLSRSTLRQLALDTLPPRNDLYAYIESGAIAEAFLPLYRLRQMEETTQEAEIQALFESVRQLFNEDATVKYEHLRNKIHVFLERESCYSTFEKGSLEKLNTLERLILRRERHSAKWLEVIESRLKEEQERRKRTNSLWAKPEDVYEWLLKDLRCYFVDKARFSFREYFQPPLALISDPRCLHTSHTVSLDDVLRVVRFYEARYFSTLEEWEQNVHLPAPEKAREAIIFCQLRELREPGAQLRIGLKLDAGNKLRPQWEETYAYQLTALHGLEVLSLNDNHGLTPEIQHLLSQSFIPALVVAGKSRSAVEMWRLQKKAQYIPYSLQVTFADDEAADYWAILGTMALLVHAEIPISILKYDWGKALRNDDKPIMF